MGTKTECDGGTKNHWSTRLLYDQRVRKRSKCFGKRSYEYPEAARIVIEYKNDVALTFGEFNSYYCTNHEAWHVGHRGKSDSLVAVFDDWVLNN
jgi:hypothetical protein